MNCNRNYKGILWLFIIAVINSSVGFSQFRKTATVGYTFLEIPVTARQAALRYAAGSLVRNSGQMALFMNPAVLGFQTQSSVSISNSAWIADIQHYGAGFALTGERIGNFGVSLNYFDYGEIPQTELVSALGEYRRVGNYTAQSVSIGVSFGRQLTDRFAWGLRSKWIQERIHEFSSQNILIDIGVLYYTGFHSLRIGGYINNFGLDSRYVGDTFKMPTELRLSFAYDIWEKPEHFVTVIGEVSHPSDNPEKLHLGIQYQLHEILRFYAGYQYPADEDPYSLGLGLRMHGYTIDLALIPFGRFPSVFYITLQKEF